MCTYCDTVVFAKAADANAYTQLEETYRRGLVTKETKTEELMAEFERRDIAERPGRFMKRLLCIVIGALGGAAAGFVLGLVVVLVVWMVGSIWMNDGRRGGELANQAGRLVSWVSPVLGAILGEFYYRMADD